MGLVEYSDSESDSEGVSQQQPPPTQKSTPSAPPTHTTTSSSAATSSSAKKPFQRILDRSNPGKIVVSLPGGAASTSTNSAKHDEPPPPKRARVGTGGGAFSGFNAFLPPPKNTGKPAASAAASGSTSANSSSGKSVPRPGVNLKTGATPGFSRDNNDDDDFFGDNTSRAAEPSIPAGQKPADEVKLVGKPMMFKPLSVSRKPAAAKGKLAAIAGAKSAKSTLASAAAASSASVSTTGKAPPATPAVAKEASDEPPPKKKKKMSLFSISAEAETETGSDTKTSGGAYEPVFADDNDMSTQEAFAQYDAQFASSTSASADHYQQQQQPLVNTQNDLDSIASDLNLSAAARRELFGRRGAPDPTQSATRVINFNTDREYAANEELRASGEAQPAFNPVRAIAPGKHSLRQLVNQVQNQKDALEESFAKGHRNRSEASAKYGWR